jgi:endonuclease/exonuclease/phosphatase family metal-dependent hydrolase
MQMPRTCSVVTVLAPGLSPVRVMTTHLAYHSAKQRLAQAGALRDLHREACALAALHPTGEDGNTPFRSRPHTPHALLCGDFNLSPQAQEYALLQEEFWPLSLINQG